MPKPREEQTLAAALRRAVTEHGDSIFVIESDCAVSYAEADRRSNRLAHGLARLGIGRGTPVLVMLPNCLAFVDLWLALAKLGAVEVPVNTGYRGTSLVHLINDSLATTLVVAEELLDRIEPLAPQLCDLRRIVIFGDTTERALQPHWGERVEIVRYDDIATSDETGLSDRRAGHDHVRLNGVRSRASCGLRRSRFAPLQSS